MTCAAPVVYIPLDRAAMCLACEVIFALADDCPACGSANAITLSRWLNREPLAG